MRVGSTGFTDDQQAALYYSRRRRRQRLAGGTTTDWTSGFALSDGTKPAIALDFLNARYYDGSNNAAALSSMVSGSPVVNASGMVANAHYSVIGPLLVALQGSAVTVVAEVTSNNAAAYKGLLAGATSAAQILVISDTNYLSSFAQSTSLNVNPTDPRDWTVPRKVATCWNASGRSIVSSLSFVTSDAHTFSAPASAVIGALDASDAFPFGGTIRSLAVYPARVSNAVLDAAVRGMLATEFALGSNGAYVDCGASTLAYEWTQPWTAVARVKPTGSGAYGAIIFTNCGTTSKVNGYEMWIGGPGAPGGAGHLFVRLLADWANTKYIGVYGSTNLNDGNYHTVAATYDGSGVAAGVKLYVDGVLETMTVEMDTLAGATIVGNNQMELFNQAPNGSSTVKYQGYCKYFSISNVVRSAGYIAALDVRYGPETAANLQMVYDFNVDGGTVVADSSGNASNGTVVGTPVTEWAWLDTPQAPAWADYWILGGTTAPSIVLDFENNRYYATGTGNGAPALASLVQNAGTVDANGLNFTGANNVNCIGAFLAALQAAAVTAVVSIKGLPNTQVAGILAFGSGNPDAPLLVDDSNVGFWNAWNGTTLATNYNDNVAINSSTGPVNCAVAWNAGNRKIVWNNTSPVASVASSFAQPVTSAKLGNYAANALPYTGKIRNIAIYPGYVSDTLLKGASWRGPWRITPFGTGGKGLKILSGDRLYAVGATPLNWEKTQAWTMTATFFLQTGNLSATVGNILFANVGLGAPWTGYEAYVEKTSKKIRVRIMSGWDGTSANNRIEVDGSSNVCDAHNIVHITYDGSGVAAGVKIYVNGVLDTMTVNVDNLTGSIVNANKFCVACQEDATGTHGSFALNDLMMAFILDNVARSAAYVSQYGSPAGYMGIAPAPDANTQLYYDFRELTGVTTRDRSVNGYNGLATTATWVTAIW